MHQNKAERRLKLLAFYVSLQYEVIIPLTCSDYSQSKRGKSWEASTCPKTLMIPYCLMKVDL